MPSILKAALEWVVARDSSTTREAQRGGVGYEPDQSPTLTADYRQPAIVSLQGDGSSSNGNQNGGGYSEDGTAYTVNGRDRQSVCIRGSMVGRTEGNGPNGGGYSENLSFTLDTIDRHAVAFAQNTRDEVRLFGGDGQTVDALAAQPGMKQTSYVMMQFGEVADTLRARADSSPNVDGGQNIVCMESAQTRAAIEVDQSPTLNASHEQPIVCAADDNGKAAIEEDMCGALKVGGGAP